MPPVGFQPKIKNMKLTLKPTTLLYLGMLYSAFMRSGRQMNKNGKINVLRFGGH